MQEQRVQLAAKLEELQQTLDLLDYKIDVYENLLLKTEQELSQAED